MTPPARLLNFLSMCTCPVDELTARRAAQLTGPEYMQARTTLENTRLAHLHDNHISILTAGASMVEVANVDYWGVPQPIGAIPPKLAGMIQRLEHNYELARRKAARDKAYKERTRKAEQTAKQARTEAEHLAMLGLPRRCGGNAKRGRSRTVETEK